MPSRIRRAVSSLKTELQIWKDFRKFMKGPMTPKAARTLLWKIRESGLSPTEAKALKFEIALHDKKFTSDVRAEFHDFLYSAPFEATGESKGWASKRGIKQPQIAELPSTLDASKNRSVEVGRERHSRLVINGISGTDPVQRTLGDCFLVASMSSVAKMSPEVLEKSFKKNKDGTWNVRLFEERNGKFTPTWVTVDDVMPKDVFGKNWYTSGSNPKELWPALMEKAFAARAPAGYATLDRGGTAGPSLEVITGKPSSTYQVKDQDESAIFNSLKLAMARKQPTVAYTRGDQFSNELDYQRLVPKHMYSVIGVVEKDGKQFIELRNPWANFEPRGDAKDDGVFQMPLGDFRKYFKGLAVNG